MYGGSAKSCVKYEIMWLATANEAMKTYRNNGYDNSAYAIDTGMVIGSNIWRYSRCYQK